MRMSFVASTGEVDVVANDARAPGRRKKPGETALAGLIRSQGPDERFPVERRHVACATPEWRALDHDGRFQVFIVTPA